MTEEVYIVVLTIGGCVSSCTAYGHRASADFAIKDLMDEERMSQPNEGIWLWQTPHGHKRARLFRCTIQQ